MLGKMLNRVYNNLIKPGNKIIRLTSPCAHMEVFVTLNAQIIYLRLYDMEKRFSLSW